MVMKLYNAVKHAALARLPESWRQALKKWQGPAWIRRHAEQSWPLGALVRRLLQPGQTAVDVGANFGYVTYILAQAVGPNGKVYSIEPIPATFDLLQSNMRRLHLNQAVPLNYAVSAEARDAVMEIPFFPDGTPNYYESKVLAPGAVTNLPTARVRLRRLSELLKDVPAIHFIKIDAEGHELDVVRGAWEFIQRNRPILLIEVWGDPDQPGTAAADLFALLAKEGYGAYAPEGGRLAPRQKGQAAGDYFFLHPDRLPAA